MSKRAKQFRPGVNPGVKLMLLLAALAGLFALVLVMSSRDRDRMVDEVQLSVDRQAENYTQRVNRWYDATTREQARQLAAPFLWDVESLEGVTEGSPEWKRLQQRMWQFVFGRETQPVLGTPPVGPLESVVVVDRHHRIVAASDPLVVEKQFTDPNEVALLDRALEQPQITPRESRSDGLPVLDLTTAVPNARGELIGIVRMRFVGSQIGSPPTIPTARLHARPHLLGPFLAGVVALLGVLFGVIATRQVLQLTRRLEAMAEGVRLPPASGPGERALSLIEDRLEQLSEPGRRDDRLLASLADAMREGLVLLDPSGEPVIVSREARLALLPPGTSEGEACRAFRILVSERQELAALIKDGLDRGQAVRERALALPAIQDTAPREVQITSFVLHDGERASGIMLLVKDQRSIESLERNLREASRLAAIGVLTRSIAHEVKNPLGAIGIHLEQLRRRLVRSEMAKDEDVDERIRVIREEIDRLQEVLREWLHLTAPEADSIDHASMDHVLDSVARLIRVEARHQNVELIVERSGELGRAQIGTGALRQVLLNLTLNALQAMPEGGRLELSSWREGSAIRIDVRDSGAGIPEPIRDQVFDVHFTTREGGSGLGLAICKRLVEAGGGRIGFESNAGKGTVFQVTLPAASSEIRAVS